MQITASQFLAKLCDACRGIVQSCNSVFASVSYYILETKQARVEVIIECEYEVTCSQTNVVISKDLE